VCVCFSFFYIYVLDHNWLADGLVVKGAHLLNHVITHASRILITTWTEMSKWYTDTNWICKKSDQRVTNLIDFSVLRSRKVVLWGWMGMVWYLGELWAHVCMRVSVWESLIDKLWSNAINLDEWRVMRNENLWRWLRWYNDMLAFWAVMQVKCISKEGRDRDGDGNGGGNGNGIILANTSRELIWSVSCAINNRIKN